MTVVTWTANLNEWDKTGAISLRGGSLIFRIGQAADLTSDEINLLRITRVLVDGGSAGSSGPAWAPAFADEDGNIGRQTGSIITEILVSGGGDPSPDIDGGTPSTTNSGDFDGGSP